MIDFRKTLAGGLTAALCVLGLTIPADAATNGRGGRRGPDYNGQGAPVYHGRKTGDHPKLDGQLNDRARSGLGRTRAIVVLKPGCSIDGDVNRFGGRRGRRLGLISGQVVELPASVLKRLADNPCVASIHYDRPLGGEMNRAAVTLGARAIQQQLGFDGAGVGVAIIDSGITSWHNDLTYHGSNPNVQVVGGQRVTKFVDFVNGLTAPYDDNGHGSHVAGIIAGNGWDTMGSRAGIAPAADLVSLKVLDSQGGGYISNVIAALDWIVANHAAYNIRVVNLSVGAAVTESYLTDPLTLATKRVVDQGVVVVSAAGNLGKVNGQMIWGAITAPGNAPWVLTVGADSHNGTITRTDDVMADYSSRGPTNVDYGAKPDVVAPGTGIVSLSVPGSTLYTLHPTYLLAGSLLNGNKPYMSLTGTSMASPMVTGTVALMMQANPALTPNLAKAIIEYTAQDYNYPKLVQGAGFLNTEGAVKLARYLYTATPGSVYPSNAAWGRTILWGNRLVKNGVIKPAGSAYGLNIVWGTSTGDDANGGNIVWGTHCAATQCDNMVWGIDGIDAANIVWGTYSAPVDNVIWGLDTADDANGQNIVWGTACADSNGCDNIVWGTACDSADCLNTIWSTNIVWGTDCADPNDCGNVVWGTDCADPNDCGNVVWGTNDSGTDDNIVWGTNDDGTGDNIVWGTADGGASPVFDDPDSPTSFDDVPFESLFGTLVFPPRPPAPPPVNTPPPTPPPAPPVGGGSGGGVL